MKKKGLLFLVVFLFSLFLFPNNVFASEIYSDEEYEKLIDLIKKDEKADLFKLTFEDGKDRTAFFAYGREYENIPKKEHTGFQQKTISKNILGQTITYAGIGYYPSVLDLKKYYPYLIFNDVTSNIATNEPDYEPGKLRHTKYVNFYKTDDITIKYIEDTSQLENNYSFFVPKNYKTVDEYPLKHMRFKMVYDNGKEALFVLESWTVEDFDNEYLYNGSNYGLTDDFIFNGFASTIYSSTIEEIKDPLTGETFTDYTKINFYDSIVSGNGLGALNTPTSLGDILLAIPKTIIEITSAFALVGTLFSTLLATFPPIITIGLYSVFTIGIIILLIKVMT